MPKHLKQNPEAILVVTGHTDDTGPERVNRKLSLTRARWIREQLVKLGVGEDRITIRGVAHDEPVASGKSSKARKKNRRVEFEIVMDEVADPTEALASLVPEEAAEEPVTADETPDETAEEEVVEEGAVSGDEEATDEDGVEEAAAAEDEAVEEVEPESETAEDAPAEEEVTEDEAPEEEPKEEEVTEEPEPLPIPEEVAPLPALEPIEGAWYTEPLWINTAVTTTFLTTSISLALASSASVSSANGEIRGTADWEDAMSSAESRATAAAWMYGFTTVSALLNGWLAYEKYVSDEQYLTPYLRFDPSGWFGGVSIPLD